MLSRKEREAVKAGVGMGRKTQTMRMKGRKEKQRKEEDSRACLEGTQHEMDPTSRGQR